MSWFRIAGAVILLAVSSPVLGAPPEQRFQSIYGVEIDKAKTPPQKIRLARKLLDDGRGLKDDAPLQKVVWRNAYRLVEKLTDTPDGFSIAIEAMDLLVTHKDCRDEADETTIDLLEAQFKRPGAPARRQVDAAALVAKILQVGERKLQEEKIDDAIRLYKRAVEPAGTASANRAELNIRIQSATDRKTIAEKVRRLKDKAAANPNDADAARELVVCLHAEAARLSEVGPYLPRLKDATIERIGRLALNNPDTLDAEDALMLGKWFMEKSKDLKGTGRATALSRAMAYFDRFLKAYSKEDDQRLIAKRARDNAADELKGLPPAIEVLKYPGAPGTPPTKLVVNGDFETVANGQPVGWEAEGGPIAIGVEGGNHFLTITHEATKQKTVVKQTIPVDPSWVSVTIKGRMRVRNLQPGKDSWNEVHIGVSFSDDAGKRIGDWPGMSNLRKDSDWKVVTNVVKIPAGATWMSLSPGIIYCAGTADFDDIEVIPTTAPKGSAAAKLVVNGDFEAVVNGQPAGWEAKHGPIGVGAEGGNHFLTITHDKPKSALATQWIALDPVWTSVTLKGRVRVRDFQAGNGQNNKVQLGAAFKTEAREQLGEYPGVSSVRDNCAWKELSRTYKIPAGAKWIMVSPGILGCAGTADFDDIEVIPSPNQGAQLKESNAVDLLARVDVQRDTKWGHWNRTAEGLVSGDEPPKKSSKLKIGCPMPREYELHIQFTISKDWAMTVFGCPHPKGNFTLVTNYGDRIAFEHLNGMGAGNANNPTIVKFRILKDRRYDLVLRVRASGITALIDGDPVCDYKGDLKELAQSKDAPWWVNPDEICIAAHCSTVIHKLELTALDAK